MTTKVSDAMLESGGAEPPPPVGGFSPGMRIGFCGTVAPDGWLFCHGQAVSRATYAALFTAIGTAFGAGDGSTTFNIPDYRGRVAIGRDNMGGTPANRVTSVVSGLAATTLGATGGDQRLHGHTHAATVTDPGHNHLVPSRINDTPNDFIAAGAGSTAGADATLPSTTGITVANSTTGGGSSENIPPAIVENMIIKT